MQKRTNKSGTPRKDNYSFDAIEYVQELRAKTNARRKKEIAEYSEDKKWILELIYGKLN